MPAIVTLQNVSKSFAVEGGMFRQITGSVLAADNVSLSLEKGRILGIVGESGSGKTTLGRIMCRLIKPDSGEAFIGGKPIGAYSRRELGHKVQMVFQDPFASLNPKLTIGTMLAEAALHLEKSSVREKVAGTLRLVGLDGSILHAYPHQFSGGQRQRIALARALIREPELIVADEPLSALDVTIQNQLLKLFAVLKESLGVSFVFISHDIVATAAIADSCIVMKEGRIVEEGDTRKVITAPVHPYTQRLLAAVP